MARRLKALEDENAKLKRLLAEQMLDMAAMREFLQEKVTPAVKREAVAHLKAHLGRSELQALSRQSGGLNVAQVGRAYAWALLASERSGDPAEMAPGPTLLAAKGVKVSFVLRRRGFL